MQDSLPAGTASHRIGSMSQRQDPVAESERTVSEEL